MQVLHILQLQQLLRLLLLNYLTHSLLLFLSNSRWYVVKSALLSGLLGHLQYIYPIIFILLEAYFIFFVKKGIWIFNNKQDS